MHNTYSVDIWLWPQPHKDAPSVDSDPTGGCWSGSEAFEMPHEQQVSSAAAGIPAKKKKWVVRWYLERCVEYAARCHSHRVKFVSLVSGPTILSVTQVQA